MKTARKPDPCATVASPKMTRTAASVRSAYRPSFGSGTRRMNSSSSQPPASPIPAPTAICSANVTAMWPIADPAEPVAPISATSSAMPTGSLAPDSPSSMTPVRPPTSRRPSTENTTAGSVGDRAVPSSSASRQPIPNRKCAAVAMTPAVTNVPATPSQPIA